MKKLIDVFVVWFTAIRVHHWVKNVFVFIPLIFSGNLLNLAVLPKTIIYFFAFCLISSSVYLFNDLMDIRKDQAHPKKRLRPIASGRISVVVAVITIVIFLVIAALLSVMFNNSSKWILIAYLANNIFYSFYLKNKVLADVLSISIGFMLRFIGGAEVINVVASRWLLVCGFSLSLFLAFGKRRAEIELLNNAKEISAIRATLESYDKDKLNTALAVVNSICIMTYLLYVSAPETIAEHHSGNLLYTAPIVIYCLFRYMYKAQEGKGSGPVEIVFKDKVFLFAIFIWLIVVFTILYWHG